MKDELGARIKEYYEDALRVRAPRQTYLVLRIDGRAFHTFTKDLDRPYSQPLAAALDDAALALCQEMLGCRFAFGQSDEYSFLLTDFESDSARMWFDGNVQKIVSVGASYFGAVFAKSFPSEKIASFDARLLVIPQPAEIEKYFIWRQLDASANSLNMLASAHYTHEELLNRTEAEKHDLLHRKGINWAKEAVEFKRGRVVRRNDGRAWIVDREPPIFQRDPAYLAALIPRS